MPRDECEFIVERDREVEQNEELAINIALDFKGPLHIKFVHKNPTLKSPSYYTIFNPLPIQNRMLNKVYEKLALHKNWAIQHAKLKDNYK